jgi:hypothetical protein
MAIDNSFLLQQMLNEQTKANDHLTAMREVLADSLKVQIQIAKGKGKNGSGGSGGNGNPPPGPGDRRRGGGPRPPDFSGGKFFKQMFGEMKNISRTALGNSASAANVVGSLGTSVGALGSSLKMIPGPVGAAATAFTAIVDVGMKVYDYMNQQLDMYNQLNSAGLTLRDGMISARLASGKSYMSLNEFNAALQQNSQSIAAMDGQYGDGVSSFANLLGSVQDLQQANGIYGVSQQQLADITAKNFKYQKLYGTQESLRSINQASSTAEFVNQMTYLSKSVGKSVDELLGKFDSMGETLDSTVSQYAMTDNWGVDPDKAAEVTKAMNSAFVSMGETGNILQKINASRLSLYQLPDEYNNQFMQGYADMMESLQRSGVTDSKVVRETMAAYVKEHSEQLRLELISQQRSGNTQAAALLTQIQNQEKLFNDSNTKTNAQLEQYTSNFNIWISKTFTQPFNEMYNNLQLSTMKYLSDMTMNADGVFDVLANISTDAYNYFNSKMAGMFGVIGELPARLGKIILGDEAFNTVKAAYDKFMGDVVQLPARLGSLIWDWLTGSDMDKSKEQLQGTVKNMFGDFNAFWDSLSNIKFDYSDMKTRIQDAFEDMKKSISGWWDTAKSWFSDDPVPEEAKKQAKNGVPVTTINTNATKEQQTVVAANKPQQPPVLAEPPQNKPERISEEAKKATAKEETPAVPDPLFNYDEAMLAQLKSLVGATDANNSNIQQMAQLLRQISENTETARQT